MTGGTEGALTGGYRVVRRLAVGDRCTVWLAARPTAHDGAEERVVLRSYAPGADPDLLAVESAALAGAPPGILPALVDVIGDGAGTTLVVEYLDVGLPALLAERAWAPGEAVTLLAGVREAVLALESAGFAPERLVPGQVMLDRAGRPRLVGLGALRDLAAASGIERSEAARSAIAAYGGLVRAVGAPLPDPRVLDPLADWCDRAGRSRPFARDDAEWERRLFGVATPTPISRADRPAAWSAGADAAAHAGSAVGSEEGVPGRPASDAAPSGGRAAAWAGILQLPEQSAEAWELELDAGVLARLRNAIRARRRPLVVGAALTASVLVLALTLLQGSEPADASGEAADPTSTAGPASNAIDGVDAGASESDAAWRPPGPDVDAVDAAAMLLDRRARCLERRSERCLDDVVQPGSSIEADDRAWIGSASDGVLRGDAILVDVRGVAVVDELGDAVLVVVDLGGPETPPASALIVRGEAGWRLRSLRE